MKEKAIAVVEKAVQAVDKSGLVAWKDIKKLDFNAAMEGARGAMDVFRSHEAAGRLAALQTGRYLQQVEKTLDTKKAKYGKFGDILKELEGVKGVSTRTLQNWKKVAELVDRKETTIDNYLESGLRRTLDGAGSVSPTQLKGTASAGGKKTKRVSSSPSKAAILEENTRLKAQVEELRDQLGSAEVLDGEFEEVPCSGRDAADLDPPPGGNDQELETMRGELREARTKIASLTQEHDGLKEERDRARGECSELQGQVDQLNGMKTARDSAEKLRDELKADNERLRAELENLKTANQTTPKASRARKPRTTLTIPP